MLVRTSLSSYMMIHFASDIVVRPVSCRREQRNFLNFPWTLYRNDPNWIPPLRADQEGLVGYRAHPFYEHNEAQTFVAYRRGEVCGRISGIVNRGHMEQFHERRGYFGFFECVEDHRVAERLFDAARQWLSERDLHSVRGPADPAMDYGIGVLVDGFDSPPTFLINYNPPYYADLIERCGFHKAQDLYSYVSPISRLPEVEPNLQRAAAHFRRRYPVQLRPLNKARYLQDVENFLDLCNRSSREQWGYIPMTLPEVRHAARSLSLLIVPEFALAAELDGKLIGALLAVPDYNPRIKQIDGRLFPLGFLRLLWRRKRIRRLRVIIASVLPEYQRLGAGLLLVGGLVSPLLRWGIQECEFSWVAESNAASRSTLERAGVIRTKTHRVYDLDQ
jgi:hypothetical protein